MTTVDSIGNQGVLQAEVDKTAPSTEVGGAPSRCRFCQASLHQTFVDLGMSPLCESYVSANQLNQMEPFYPLARSSMRSVAFLVQLEEYVSPESIFVRLRILLILFGHLARPRQGVRRTDDHRVSA